MISFLDKLFFVKHFAVLIKSGVPILQALQILQDEARSRAMKGVLQKVKKSVESGESLSESMKRFPKAFPRLVVKVVGASEEAGTLEENLRYLAEQMAKDNEMRRKVISALTYPAIVLFATGMLGVLLVTFVLPKIIPVFKSLKVELPLITRILLGTFEFFQTNLLLVGGVAGILILGYAILLRFPFFQIFSEKILRRLPVAGSLSQGSNLARFCRTLGTLLQAGVPLPESLAITRGVSLNLLYREGVGRVIERVQKGSSFAEALRKEKVLFSPLTSAMFEVGEKSGTLQESAFYLAEFYEGEVDTLSKNLATVIEPFLLIFIGLLVGLTAVSIILPMYQVLGKLG
jgi:type II secretory pathway component PulF